MTGYKNIIEFYKNYIKREDIIRARLVDEKCFSTRVRISSGLYIAVDNVRQYFI